MTIMIIFGVFAVMLYQTQVETISSSKAFDNNDEFLKTEIDVLSINASSGSSVVNFTFSNQGSEKLWNFDEFDVLITYDANILGVRTPVTEQLTYNASAYEESTGQAVPSKDFKIQRDELIMTTAEISSFITAGADFDECVGPCFIRLVNSQHTGNGWTGPGGGNQNVDDFTTYISNDDGLRPGGLATIEFERHGNNGGNRDNRLQWEIIEFIGKNQTDNEMKVWDTGTCTYVGSSTTCDGASIPTFIGSDEKVVVFLTGQANEDLDRNDYPDCMNTSEWVKGTNIPRFTRIGGGTNVCDVSYAVVEFSGSNWSVQRIEHVFTAGVATQTESISDVGDISQTFFHHQQRNQDSSSSDDVCRIGSEVELLQSDILTYRLPQTTSGWDSSMQSVTWIISNSETYPSEIPIVEYLNPPEEPSGGAPEEHNWQVAITPLTYQTSETIITGLSAQGATCGNTFPRGHISAILTDSTTVDLYLSDRTTAHEYTFQVVQLPRSHKCAGGVSWIIESNEWTLNCIMYDDFEPRIVNPNEVTEALIKLEYPIFTNGFVEISMSSDNGKSDTENTKAS